ncbi:MAG: tRNA (5-methylaminomethyl-2-thiouridine)(34)-methyltransferase MnmD [Bacteroidota bacterium]
MFIQTKDGSYTLINKELNVYYHSIHGALQESLHVFIQSGIDYYFAKNTAIQQLDIFEMGFGTGLNCLLAYAYLESKSLPVRYVSIEKYPLESFDTSTFIHNISDYINHETIFNQMHSAAWNKMIHLNPHFELYKIKDDICLYSPEQSYDIIFFDAFAPSVQAELWNVEMMKKMYDYLKLNGILLTYCAQGQFKRNLKASGFTIESIPGPPGKREMTRAHKL